MLGLLVPHYPPSPRPRLLPVNWLKRLLAQLHSLFARP